MVESNQNFDEELNEPVEKDNDVSRIFPETNRDESRAESKRASSETIFDEKSEKISAAAASDDDDGGDVIKVDVADKSVDTLLKSPSRCDASTNFTDDDKESFFVADESQSRLGLESDPTKRM